MERKKVSLFGLLSVVLVLLVLSPAGAQVFKLKLADMSPSKSEVALGGQKWASEVEKRTEGRVKIEQFWDASLVSAMEQTDAVIKGNIDVTAYLSGYHPEMCPIPVLASFPLLSPGNLKVSIFAVDEWVRTDPGVIAELKKNNVKYLYPFNNMNQYLWTKKPIKGLSDLKGIRLRTTGPFLTLFKNLGCSLVNVPMPEVYDTLERGVVDGTTQYLSIGVGLRLSEVVKNVNITNLGDNLACPIVMNINTWNRLPGDIQKIIDQVNVEMVDAIANISTTRKNECMEILKSSRVSLTEFSPNDVDQMKEIASKNVWEPYIKSVDKKGIACTEAFQHYLKLLEKYSKMFPSK